MGKAVAPGLLFSGHIVLPATSSSACTPQGAGGGLGAPHSCSQTSEKAPPSMGSEEEVLSVCCGKQSPALLGKR